MKEKLDNMFGVIGDPHIINREYITTKKLKVNVSQLNELDLNFVFVTGDIAHRARIDEFQLAKKILDELDAEYYCCHGNHDYGGSRNSGLNLDAFQDAFGITQFVKQVCGFNLIILQLEWRKVPLEINRGLPSIALIHSTSATDQYQVFPVFDNPELEGFLKRHGVKAVFQGHIHEEQKTIYHNGIQYINCSTGFGIGCLGDSVLYAPVTSTIEEAFSELISMRDGNA